MKKINMLYDATLFARGYFDPGIKTGIFFVGYNILKQFVNDDRFDIILYVHDETRAVTFFKKDDLLSPFPVCINNEETPRFNINVHKNNIKKTANITKKIIYSLKILKNYLFLFFFYRDNSRLLETVDMYFSTTLYTAPREITKFPNIKHFLVLHDTIPVIFPQYYPEIFSGDYWFNRLTKSLNKYAYYFFNSENTKNDFLKYYGKQFDENKLFVTYIASSQCFFPDYNKTKLGEILGKYRIEYNKDNNYVFSFCNLEPRKNLPFTVRCFVRFIKKHNINNLYFYFGGGQWKEFLNSLEEQIKTGILDEYRDKIVRLGYVDDEDVNILYSNSVFFTYISQYEGFGMPPLEAMRAGTPVITSNNSSLPEVTGDAAIMIDYDDEEQCIKAFEDLYFNEDLRRYYISKGIERAKLFSWEKTADKMKEVIVKAVT
jgi:glycosyltransferase involved in cell wall biosynthesis